MTNQSIGSTVSDVPLNQLNYQPNNHKMTKLTPLDIDQIIHEATAMKESPREKIHSAMEKKINELVSAVNSQDEVIKFLIQALASTQKRVNSSPASVEDWSKCQCNYHKRIRAGECPPCPDKHTFVSSTPTEAEPIGKEHDIKTNGYCSVCGYSEWWLKNHPEECNPTPQSDEEEIIRTIDEGYSGLSRKNKEAIAQAIINKFSVKIK